MAAPPQGPGPMMSQPYPGMYYQPMTPENMLSRRNVWFANVLGLGMIWLAFILRLVSLDPNLAKFDVFLVVTGALLAAVVNAGAALGSKRTSDMQNLGLFVWSGFLIAFAGSVLTLILALRF